MLIADPYRELTLEYVEPLVLFVVDVPRRAFALPNCHLDQPVFAAGLGAADLDDLEHPEQPVRLALVRTEQIPVLRAFGGNHSHVTTPSVEFVKFRLSGTEQFEIELSHAEQLMSSPTPER